jgi:hypothetical protein
MRGRNYMLKRKSRHHHQREGAPSFSRTWKKHGRRCRTIHYKQGLSPEGTTAAKAAPFLVTPEVEGKEANSSTKQEPVLRVDGRLLA